jgi:hypothetical protein
MAKYNDRIEKKILLGAPLERVWRAVSDARSVEAWFGVDFDGTFVHGARMTGTVWEDTLANGLIAVVDGVSGLLGQGVEVTAEGRALLDRRA